MNSPPPLPLQYEPGSARKLPLEHRFWLIMLKIACGYLIVSAVTLPFMDAIWIGEVPLLALPQVPKAELAGSLRTGMVMPIIRRLGASKGSFSPDYTTARPYALAIAYILPIGILMALVAFRTRLKGRLRRWSILLIFLAVADYAVTLVFASTRSLTIY